MFTEGGARAAEDGSVCYDELDWCLIYLELVLSTEGVRYNVNSSPLYRLLVISATNYMTIL